MLCIKDLKNKFKYAYFNYLIIHKNWFIYILYVKRWSCLLDFIQNIYKNLHRILWSDWTLSNENVSSVKFTKLNKCNYRKYNLNYFFFFYHFYKMDDLQKYCTFSGGKDFVYNECSKTVFQNNNLNAHSHKYVLEKSVICEICCKGFFFFFFLSRLLIPM